MLHQQITTELQQLQHIMQELDLWQATSPAQQAFLSEQPFAIDTMSANEWLQWIFIPRMYALIEQNGNLPREIAISPYLEEALKEMDRLEALLEPILNIETLLKKA